MKMWESRNSMVVANYRDDVPFYQELGQLIGHEKKVVEVAGDYGYRLKYWGWVDSSYWPSQMDTNLRQLAGQDSPDFSAEFAQNAAGADLFRNYLPGRTGSTAPVARLTWLIATRCSPGGKVI